MKERLLEIFKQNNYQPKNFQELYEILELSEESKDELQKALNELLDEYEIFLSRKNRYTLPSEAHIYKGVISIKNPDYGFITSPNFEKDFYVSKNKMGGAMDKDYVVFGYSIAGFKGDVKGGGGINGGWLLWRRMSEYG
jgi:ribonuclease R